MVKFHVFYFQVVQTVHPFISDYTHGTARPLDENRLKSRIELDHGYLTGTGLETEPTSYVDQRCTGTPLRIPIIAYRQRLLYCTWLFSTNRR